MTASFLFSFYENIIKNITNPDLKSVRSSKTMRSFTSTSLTSGSLMQLHSVSEQVLYTGGDVQNRNNKGKKKALPPEPVVGSLGPDIIAMKDKVCFLILVVT